MIIRCAIPADAEAILNIYAPHITGSCVSFETEVPALDAFASRIEGIVKTYPYLVCEDDGSIVGYAYASKHRERAAYKYSADVSVYISPKHHRRGIGKALYMKLFELLKQNGVYTVFAGVTLPNENSVGLHSALGFTEVGTYHNVGYKFGKWLDVMWFEKPLINYDKPEM